MHVSSMQIGNQLKKVLFSIYLILLILFVSMKFNGSFRELWIHAAFVRENRVQGNLNANFDLLSTIKVYLRLRNVNPIYLRNLLGNIIPFLPMGTFEGMLRKRKNLFMNFLAAMWHCLFIILLIEVVQLITGLGYFDVDDILLNMIGCFMGYCFYIPFHKSQKKILQ